MISKQLLCHLQKEAITPIDNFLHSAMESLGIPRIASLDFLEPKVLRRYRLKALLSYVNELKPVIKYGVTLKDAGECFKLGSNQNLVFVDISRDLCTRYTCNTNGVLIKWVPPASFDYAASLGIRRLFEVGSGTLTVTFDELCKEGKWVAFDLDDEGEFKDVIKDISSGRMAKDIYADTPRLPQIMNFFRDLLDNEQLSADFFTVRSRVYQLLSEMISAVRNNNYSDADLKEYTAFLSFLRCGQLTLPTNIKPKPTFAITPIDVPDAAYHTAFEAIKHVISGHAVTHGSAEPGSKVKAVLYFSEANGCLMLDDLENRLESKASMAVFERFSNKWILL